MDTQWFKETADHLTGVIAAITQTKPDAVERTLNAGIAGIGAAGTTAGISGVASLVGSASTGTAISTLSGAAATSATLAWVGGSVATGTIVVTGAAFLGGWLLKRAWKTKPREEEALSDQEKNIKAACFELAKVFEEQAVSTDDVDKGTMKVVVEEGLIPLQKSIESYSQSPIHEAANRALSWRNRQRILSQSRKLKDKIAAVLDKNRIYVNVVPAVVLKLLSEDAHAFTGDELLVLDAFRRSDNSLSEASPEQIGEYLQEYSPGQLQGITNNVKGIFHELKFVDAENADGDSMTAELFELTNHPGADVRLTNTETGETHDIQLKATNSPEYVEEHQTRYPDIEIVATNEVASKISDVDSSGFSNVEITEAVSGAIDDLGTESHYIEGSAALTGILSAAINTKAVLSGQQNTPEAMRKILEDVSIAGVTATLIEILVS